VARSRPRRGALSRRRGKSGKQWAGHPGSTANTFNHLPGRRPRKSEARHAEITDVIPVVAAQHGGHVEATTDGRLFGAAGIRDPRHQYRERSAAFGLSPMAAISMLNPDITDLYQRVSVGTTVW